MKEDHIVIIRRLAKSMARRTGISEDEYFAEGCLSYLRAVANYDKRREGMTLDKWIAIKAKGDMLDVYRNTVRYWSRFKQLPDNVKRSEVPPFDIGGFLDILSQDARHVVQLVLDMPETIQRVALDMSNQRRTYNTDEITSTAYEGSLREYFLGFGWTKERIREAFKEVRTALKTL